MLGEAIASVVGKVIDRAWPDPLQKAQAMLELEKLKVEGAFREMDTALSAIKTEAASNDPWTSRARPSFLYVFYFILIALVVLAPIVGITNPSAMALLGTWVLMFLISRNPALYVIPTALLFRYCWISEKVPGGNSLLRVLRVR